MPYSKCHRRWGTSYPPPRSQSSAASTCKRGASSCHRTCPQTNPEEQQKCSSVGTMKGNRAVCAQTGHVTYHRLTHLAALSGTTPAKTCVFRHFQSNLYDDLRSGRRKYQKRGTLTKHDLKKITSVLPNMLVSPVSDYSERSEYSQTAIFLVKQISKMNLYPL